MIKNNYSQIGNVSLDRCGLLSNDNDSMMDFLNLNDVHTVCDFLSLMDSANFKRRRFINTVNEARGLADLLKYKYFNMQLVVDCYLDSVISMGKFNVYGELFSLPMVRDYSGKKINLYSAITRLGFTDEERNIILDREQDSVIGSKLIDLLTYTCEKLGKKENHDDNDTVLLNKLLLIISYYRSKFQLVDLPLEQNVLYSFENLNAILSVRDRLEMELKQVNEIIANYGGANRK